MSNSKEEYSKIIKDLSGSIVQNRFKFQRFWAINKIYELYNSDKDFIMIFDFVCDIDVCINNDFYFYQVKTDKNKNFTVKRLTEIKNENKHSILSKLAFLEKYENTKTLNIVSNNFLTEKDRTGKQLQIICLNDLENEVKNKIKKHIQDKITILPDLSKYFYIKSDLCLDSSYKTLLGCTVEFLEHNFDTTSTKASFFLDWLLRITEIKTTYEYDGSNFNDIVANKGITKEQFSQLLRDYDSTNNKVLKHVDKIINDNYELYDAHRVRLALKEITISIDSIRNKKSLEEIRKYILDNEIFLVSKNIKEIINKIVEEFDFDFSYEYYDKKCLAIIAIAQFEEGMK